MTGLSVLKDNDVADPLVNGVVESFKAIRLGALVKGELGRLPVKPLLADEAELEVVFNAWSFHGCLDARHSALR